MISDYRKSLSQRYYLGYGSISFRTSNASRDSNMAFVLNSSDDGWFRRVPSGLGLCVKDLKITSKKPIKMGDYNVYKCSIDYIDYSENKAKDFFWLYVHENFELEEMLEYIEDHKHEWIP